jgi:hypothetical protein
LKHTKKARQHQRNVSTKFHLQNPNIFSKGENENTAKGKGITDDLNTTAEGVDGVSSQILNILSLYSGLNIKALPTLSKCSPLFP